MAARRWIDRFEILAVLSSGGMGTVHLARRSAAGVETLCALKTVKPELSENAAFRAMFLDEVRLLSRLRHPAVAQLFEVGEAGGELYVALELVQGVPFTRFATGALGPPPPGVAARLVAAACRGLHAAHELRTDDGRDLQVVHRDVSPQNLMLSFDGFVKVLDFGIALAAERSAQPTQLGDVKGKPAYMAPEQLSGGSLDRRTDIWSASVVLHELLTGQHLFEGNSALAVALAINEGRVAPPSRVVPGLDARFDQLVMRGLSVSPADRFATARELAEALDALADATAAESLESFAARALATERRWFEDKLAAARAGAPAGAPANEADATAPAGPGAASRKSGKSRRAQLGQAAAILASLLAAAFAIAVWLPRTAPPPAPVIAVAEPEPAPAPPPPPSEPDPKPTPVPPAPPPLRPRPVRPAPAPAAPVVAFGKVSVDARPYGRVRIDGEDLGETPRLDVQLKAGPHQIDLISPVDGAVRETRTVQLDPGTHQKVLFGPK